MFDVEKADVTPLDRSPEVSAVQPLCIELLVMLDGSPITSQQREELSQLLQRFSGVFSLSDRNTGKCTLIKHCISTGDNPPIKQHAYQASEEKQEIKCQVASLLADGLVEESCRRWLKRKGGSGDFASTITALTL